MVSSLIFFRLYVQTCLRAIAMVNASYGDDLGDAYLIPKMKKGFVGDVVETIDIPVLVVST